MLVTFLLSHILLVYGEDACDLLSHMLLLGKKNTAIVTCLVAKPIHISCSRSMMGSIADLPKRNPCWDSGSRFSVSAIWFNLFPTMDSMSLLVHCRRAMGLYDSGNSGGLPGLLMGMISPVFHGGGSFPSFQLRLKSPRSSWVFVSGRCFRKAFEISSVP